MGEVYNESKSEERRVYAERTIIAIVNAARQPFLASHLPPLAYDCIELPGCSWWVGPEYTATNEFWATVSLETNSQSEPGGTISNATLETI